MAIIDLQRRLKEIGRIRLGQKAQKGNPVKLDTFRLTSGDPERIRQAAGLFGGTAQRWEDSPSPMEQWEVVTDVASLDVIVPPGEMSFSQFYETWSRGGCQKRCDGNFDSVRDCACDCDPENRSCSIHTRLSVMIRDLPGLGVWRLDTQGYYAAVEMAGAVDVIHAAAGRGQMLPARLRLEQRQIKKPGEGAKKFAVPVIDIDVSAGELIQSTRPVTELAAPTLTPVPASVPHAPVRSVAEQAALVEETPETKPRRNAAVPITPTGLSPRTADAAGDKANIIASLVNALPASERGGVKPWLKTEYGVDGWSDLTDDQADEVITKLQAAVDAKAAS